MTRTEFVKAYAQRSGVSDRWASIGLIDMGDGWKLIALPCACGQEGCEGWAMLSAESVLHHLAFEAPDDMREAYRKHIGDLIA